MKLVNMDFDVNELPMGVDCCFIRRRKYGIKAFECRKDAIFSLKGQRKGYKVNAAPKVMSSLFKIKNKNKYDGKMYYAFKTEIASKVGSLPTEGRMYDSLMRKLHKIGYGNDMHERNIGIVKGKLVCIDFGRDSLSR